MEYTKNWVTLRNITANNLTLLNYIQKKLCFICFIGIFAAKNSNWYKIIIQIYTSFKLGLKQYFCPPQKSETFAEYIKKVYKLYFNIMVNACEKYLLIKPKKK